MGDMYMFLSDEFIEKYKDQQPPFGGNGLGELVYLRTYSRWLPDENRREQWWETVRRVVEYSLSLDKVTKHADLVKEGEELFDLIFNLKVFPAGRTLWIGGTEAAKKYPMANYNCSFRVIDSLEAFCEGFYLLMLGCGFGFRVLPTDVAKIPQLNNIPLRFISEKDILGMEKTQVFYRGHGSWQISVGDSKEGWVDSLRHYFSISLDNFDDIPVEEIVINTGYIRPKGSILKTFGGTASGPEGLIEMFRNIQTIISRREKLQPIDAMDIMNIIAYNVVVGGVRRSSQICLFDINDKEILEAKKDMYVPNSPNNWAYWRAMSNNSVYFTTKPTKQQLLDIFEHIKNNGEPGFVNAESASVRRDNFNGLNPCAEILLDNQGVCNLTEVNMKAFTFERGGGVDYYALKTAIKHATRMGVRMTLLDLELPEWDKVQKRDRLTGVSFTGIMDAWDTQTKGSNAPFEVAERWYKELRKYSKSEAEKYANKLRIPAPLLVTTVKPSGTISQLPTVSSGAHRSWGPQFIRRVRVTGNTPVAEAMKLLNYPVYPEVSQGPLPAEFDNLSMSDKDIALKQANTWVVEFPVKTGAKSRAEEENALSQFQRYLSMQKGWTEHNTSITIYFGEDEVHELVNMILKNWKNYIAISFLPKNTNSYYLMPYESISQEEYERRYAEIDRETHLYNLVNNLEKQYVDDLSTEGCENGACPVR